MSFGRKIARRNGHPPQAGGVFQLDRERVAAKIASLQASGQTLSPEVMNVLAIAMEHADENGVISEDALVRHDRERREALLEGFFAVVEEFRTKARPVRNDPAKLAALQQDFLDGLTDEEVEMLNELSEDEEMQKMLAIAAP